jgi:hypothetical protein
MHLKKSIAAAFDVPIGPIETVIGHDGAAGTPFGWQEGRGLTRFGFMRPRSAKNGQQWDLRAKGA